MTQSKIPKINRGAILRSIEQAHIKQDCRTSKRATPSAWKPRSWKVPGPAPRHSKAW